MKQLLRGRSADASDTKGNIMGFKLPSKPAPHPDDQLKAQDRDTYKRMRQVGVEMLWAAKRGDRLNLEPYCKELKDLLTSVRAPEDTRFINRILAMRARRGA